MKDENMKKRKKPGVFSNYAKMQFKKKQYGVFKFLRNIIGVLLIFGILIFVLSGNINQRELLQKSINVVLEIGRKIGNQIEKAPEGKSVIQINENGVYVPDGFNTIKESIDGTVDIIENVSIDSIDENTITTPVDDVYN